MAILNRDLDASQQKEVVRMTWPSQVSTGASLLIGILPSLGVIQSMRAVAIGQSGAMEMSLYVARNASGYTTFPVGISNLVIPGASGGVGGYSGLAAVGSTLLNVLAGDVLVATLAGANSAAAQLSVEIVIKKTQDIVSMNGIST